MKLSIITVVYNNLPGLKKTALSIEKQVCRNFEWVVVDGGSNDGTVEWLEGLSPKFNFVWVSSADDGLYDAMNKGIELSSGTHYIFMNGDDCLADDFVLEKLSKVISRESSAALIYGDSIDLDKSGLEHYRHARNISSIGRGMLTQHQAIVFAKDALGSMRYDYQSFPLSADYDLISKIIYKCDPSQVVKVNFAICTYQLGGLNEQLRLRAIKEDFLIRINSQGMGLIKARLYQIGHYCHYWLKVFFPKGMRWFRYK